jgi:chemotaxis protein methyltransferase CheR
MSRLATLAEEEFVAFRDLVGERFGLQFDESRREALRLAVRTRTLACGDGSFQEYLARLRGLPLRGTRAGPGREGELGRLVELLTIQETCFFRNPEHFQALVEAVLPGFLSRPGGPPIRIWSAGCATGEEPYSIALTLLEAGIGQAEILGTDVSEAALDMARVGRYGRRAVRLVPGLVLDRYFYRDGDHFLVGDALRRLVRFEYLNLIQEPFPIARFTGCDVVFCRNVIIYFTPESIRRLVRTVTECLAPGGVLFLGPSETLWKLSTDFELAEWGGGFYYRRRPPVLGPAPRPAAREVPTPLPSPTSQRKIRPVSKSRRETRRLAAPAPTAPSRLEEAQEALRAGDAAGAVAALEGAIAEGSGDAPPLVLLAYLRLSGGRLDAAAELAKRALARDPLCPDAHLLEGLIAWEEGRHEEATAAFKRALYLEPASALARYQLGRLYTLRRQRRRAQHEFAEAVRLLDVGVARSVLETVYPPESLRRAIHVTWEKSRMPDQV